VERLLKLLNPPTESGKQPKRYVQEQVITSLAMVADVTEKAFGKVRVADTFPHIRAHLESISFSTILL
jgi:hypothetical protein